jgi:hypothetical protein
MAVRDAFETAHEQLLDRDVSQIAAALQDALGQKLVAFAVGDRHPKTIGRYARGEREPDDGTHAQLVDLYLIFQILASGMRAASVKSWMLGANPRLRGRAPIEAFHEGRTEAVREAARIFVSKR